MRKHIARCDINSINLIFDKFIINIVDLLTQRLKYRRKTIDVVTFINIKTKIYYNV